MKVWWRHCENYCLHKSETSTISLQISQTITSWRNGQKEAGGAWLFIRKSREWPAGTVGGGPNRVPTRQTRPPYHDWYKSVSCEIPMSDPSPKTIRINHPTQLWKGQLSFLKAGDHLYGIPHLTCTKSECTFVQHAIMLVAFMVFNFLPVYLFQNLLWSLLPIFFFVFREWIFSSSIHDRLPFETFSRGGWGVGRWGYSKHILTNSIL